MIQLHVKSDLWDFLDPKKQKTAHTRLVNKLGAKALTIFRDEIYGKYAFKKKKSIFIMRKKAYAGNYANVFSATKSRTRLTAFKVKEVGRGVDVSVDRSSPTFIEGGFIHRPKGRDWGKYGQTRPVTSKVPLVFVRAGNKPYPLVRPEKKQDLTPSLGEELLKPDVQAKVRAMIDNDASKLLDSEIKYLLTGKRLL
jgi:hypothetical protein